ncbi:MarR family winged helix-turn-helix transcriptional regulator [Streptomyces sp. NPDC093261]|uniref:MarR family winged helix-turn-helix transcriptional regulator n=1 Tax=Streptomyces sp. NPDC093261 TaxID=3366037 RepID=UPI0037F76DB2
MDREDAIDVLLRQWQQSPYELPLASMAVAKRIARVARNLEQRHAEALAEFGLDPGEFDVLATLLRSGPPHELAPAVLNRSLLISSGGLTKRLTRLEKRGFVSRRLDPGDRRSLLAALTDQGLAVTAKAVIVHAQAGTGLVDPLSEADRAQLVSLLRKLLLHQES